MGSSKSKINTTVFAGSAENIGIVDGDGCMSQFISPSGIVFDKINDRYIIVDYNHNTIREISLNGKVTTLMLNFDKDYVKNHKIFHFIQQVSYLMKMGIFMLTIAQICAY